MQTTLLGFAIALILALLAALVGPHVVNWNDHRAFFEAEASRLVGLSVRVSGDIDAAILPIPSVTLRDIAIGPEGKASRLNARSLRIELGLGPLMRGELRATEMRLVAPQFSVGLAANGQIDWPPVSLAAETLSIDRLSIESGRIALTDAASQSRVLLDQFWFQGEVRSLAGPFRGKGEFVMGGGLYGYEIAAGRFGPEGSRIKLNLRTNERPLNVEVDGLIAMKDNSPHFDGALTLARPAVSVQASGKAVAHEPWRLTGKTKIQVSGAAMEDVTFQYGPDDRAVALTGTVDVKFGVQPQLEAILAARQIDLDRMLAVTTLTHPLPFPALQAFGAMLGSATRPAWPARLSVNADAVTLGGAALQNVAAAIRSDGANWTIDKLEFRAPGVTQVKTNGRLYPLGAGLGFSGSVDVNSRDVRSLSAWLSGRTTAAIHLVPWRAKGDVTLGADRIAVEQLRSEFERGTIEGSLAYTWPAGARPARVEANLRATEFDVDALLGPNDAANSEWGAGWGLLWPGEAALALEFGRVRVSGFDVSNIAARLTFEAGALAIERLSVGELAGASLAASGRIQTLAPFGGTIAANLDARDVSGIAALLDRLAPSFADPLRRLAARQKTAMLRAMLSLESDGADGSNGALNLAGQIGVTRVDVTARMTGKRDSFAAMDRTRLEGAATRFEGRLESDEAMPLLALLGLGRFVAADARQARLGVSASGALGGDFQFDGKLEAGGINVGGKGIISTAFDRPSFIKLDQFSGSFGGGAVQGRLSLGLGETLAIDGAIDAETLDAQAMIALASGAPLQRRTGGQGEGWSTDPFAWGASGLTGRVEFKVRRAALASALTAQSFQGVAQFRGSEVVIEDIAGELGKGRLEGRLAVASLPDGVSARVRFSLTDADAGAVFASAGPSPITGLLTMSAELEGVGRSPAAYIGSLAGFGTLAIERAEFADFNPDVFDAVIRAVDRGLPADNNRVRDFVAGELNKARLPVSQFSAAISVDAGQVRFRDIATRTSGPDLDVTAGIDLIEAKADARLVLGAPPASPGATRPVILVALNGPLTAPRRSIDVNLLTSWLTLRAVEQQTRQLDAIEKARREAPSFNESAPPGISPGSGSGDGAERRAPVLPPPISIPAAPGRGGAPRTNNNTLPNEVVRPPGLIRAQ